MPLRKIFRALLYAMPVALYFSYRPVILLGKSDTMNFELSIALLWLVIFCAIGIIAVIKRDWGHLTRKILQKWPWLFFPIWATTSVFWSLNPTRGILTAGILWLLYIAVGATFALRDWLDAGFWRRFERIFFTSAAVAVLWCVVQCILDLAGAEQGITLLCDGCVSEMFGFPHPNGFAIEPQFMGNLLLAPALFALYKKRYCLFGLFASGVFLTFSRGAIYSLVLGVVVIVIFLVPKNRRASLSALLKTLATLLASFLIVLNLQGVMTELGPTRDHYLDGVGKAINHLSLGLIEIRSNINEGRELLKDTSIINEGGELLIDDEIINESEIINAAIFDGYVEESTATRVRLSESAIAIWQENFPTAAFGVGLGGAGAALYDHGASPAPKEIVQNEFVSILLELGAVGIILFALTIALVLKTAHRTAPALLIPLIVTFTASICFFSGLPNALHIYLLLGILTISASQTPRS